MRRRISHSTRSERGRLHQWAGSFRDTDDVVGTRAVCKGSLTEGLERMVNRAKSRVGSRVEHVFAVVKRLWGFGKVRYRGLAKTATQAFVATAPANVFLARRRLRA
jgi:IS5 family transposase